MSGPLSPTQTLTHQGGLVNCTFDPQPSGAEWDPILSPPKQLISRSSGAQGPELGRPNAATLKSQECFDVGTFLLPQVWPLSSSRDMSP